MSAFKDNLPRLDRLWPLVALLPALGIALLFAYTHLRFLRAEVYRVPITGYDPRDLLYGQYLRFRFDVQPRAGSQVEGGGEVYCFQRVTTPPGYEIRMLVAGEGEGECDSTLPADLLLVGHKYFIPEQHAPALEGALRTEAAAVDLLIHSDHSFSVGQLYLNELPWQEALSLILIHEEGQ